MFLIINVSNKSGHLLSLKANLNRWKRWVSAQLLHCQPSRSVCFGRTQPQIRTDEGTLTGALSDPTRGRARMRSVPVPHALTAAPFPLLISTTYMGGGLANALLIEVLGRARSGPATDDVSLNLRRGYDDCVEGMTIASRSWRRNRQRLGLHLTFCFICLHFQRLGVTEGVWLIGRHVQGLCSEFCEHAGATKTEICSECTTWTQGD